MAGYEKSEVDLEIDTTKVYQIQMRAMREHKSQKQDCERIIKARWFLLREEYFLVTKR